MARPRPIKKFMSLIGLIPLLIWLFLAATQVLNLIVVPFRLLDLENSLQTLPDDPAYAEVRKSFEKIRWKELVNLTGAAVLTPIFIGLGVLRWSRDKAEQGALASKEKPLSSV